METDQLPTSRPFNSRTARVNQQTATHTWHRPLVYVKEEGNAALHLNIANTVRCLGEVAGKRGGGAMSQMQINLEMWMEVHLDESDGQPWAVCHNVFLITVMLTNGQTDCKQAYFYIT